MKAGLISTALALVACAATTSAAAESTTPRIVRLDPALDAVIAPDTKIERVAGGFKFTEGPMWREGRLWFSDLSDDKVLAVTPAGKVETLIEHAGGLNPFPANSYLGSNAMVTDKDGSVLLVQQGGRKIVRLDAKLQPTMLIEKFDGKKLNSPNDVIRSKSGVIFFTDPPYGLKGINESPAKELSFSGVYRLDPDGNLQVLDRELKYPNGIALSPDERTLYVANSDPTRPIWMAYSLDEKGDVKSKRVFADASDLAKKKWPGLPDGMRVAADGTLFASAPGGILIMTPEGKRLGLIQTEGPIANCAFGDDGRTLYLTSKDLIARIRLNIDGSR